MRTPASPPVSAVSARALFRAGLTLALALPLASGCDSGASSVADLALPPGPPDLGPRSSYSDDDAVAARAACHFHAGDLPGVSLPSDAPLGSQIPIDTIIVLVMENRSFDHLLGNLKAYGQPDAEVAPLDATNPDSHGMPVARHHDTDYCFPDTNHSWTGSHVEYNDGKNDGFARANEDAATGLDGSRALSYYTEADIPAFYEIATKFALADHYFSSLLGPTSPNREYLYAATSLGNTANNPIVGRKKTLFSMLTDAGVPWRVYYDTLPAFGIFLQTVADYLNSNVGHADEFWANLKAGTLENVVFLDPDLRNEWGGGSDLHPPGDVQNGDAYIQKVVDAITHSPQWPHTALFLTFDEHGGLYDHVPPPKACPPDDLPPNPDTVPGATFDRYGFRIPTIVISPYAKPHFVSHRVYSHASIDRFIEARFVLPAMTARDANSDPLFDLFDFSKPALLSPPSIPAPTVDAAKLAACASRYPKK